jgi:hypothetical protein
MEEWQPNHISKCNANIDSEGPDYCRDKSIRFYIYDMTYFTSTDSDSYWVPPHDDKEYETCVLGRCERHLPEKLTPWSPFKEVSYEEAMIYEIMGT